VTTRVRDSHDLFKLVNPWLSAGVPFIGAKVGVSIPSSMVIPQIRPTIRDIARKTGFHFSTVSLALRDHPPIPEATRQVIRDAAKGPSGVPVTACPMISALPTTRWMKRVGTCPE
jgi:Bacterial regulatory proteins, lacI family